MTRFLRITLTAALFLVTAASARAAVSADVEKLPFRREVQMVTDLDAAENAWIEVVEDSVIAAKAHAGFTDVRFMNEAGESLPSAGLEPTLTDIVYFPWRTIAPEWRMTGGREECVIDLGMDHPARLSLAMEQGANDPSIEITGSADSLEWSYVTWTPKPPVYRGDGRTSAALPPDPGLNLALSNRYLKLTRNNRGRTVNVPIAILRYEERPTPRETVAFTIVRSSFRDRTWQMDIAFTGPERYVGALVLEVPRATPASLPIRLESGEGESRRNVTIETLPDWSQNPRATLSLFPVRTGTLRIIVEDADPPNAPFTIVEARAVPFRWRMPLPSGPLWIAYGDDFLEPRDWNLERDARLALSVASTRLGPEEANPHHHPPGFGLEWLKRRPAVLSAIMVAMLVLVGLLTLRRRTPAALALMLMLVSCAPNKESAPLTIWAAASLTEVLPRVTELSSKPGEPPVRFTFDATSRLARQINEGAPADLFFSADERWMDALIQDGSVDPATRARFIGNDLVLVVPVDSQLPLDSPASLQSQQFTRLGLADDAVPAGRYAREALIELGLWPSVDAHVVNGSNVRTVLAWVARGEVDAGVVYASDARSEPNVRIGFVFPESSHVAITYSAAVVTGSKRRAEALAFIEFCRSDAAQTLFKDAGFRIP